MTTCGLHYIGGLMWASHYQHEDVAWQEFPALLEGLQGI